MQKKVLLIKWGAIGDVIMTLPLAQKLSEKKTLDWVIGSQIAPLVKGLNLKARLIPISEKNLLQKGIFFKLFSLINLWRKIGFRSYETIYILHKDKRYLLLSLFSFGKKVQLKQNSNFFSGKYQAKQFLKLIQENGPVLYPKPVFPLSSSFVSLLKKPLIFLAPAGASNALSTVEARRWPIVFYVKLSTYLSNLGYQILLLGNEKDKWAEPYFSPIHIKSLMGKTTLLDLIPLLNEGKLLVTHDTGIMHIAKLTSIKILALFGPSHPEECAPKTLQMHVLWGGGHLSCRPCLKENIKTTCKKNLCLQSISPEQVLNYIQSYIL